MHRDFNIMFLQYYSYDFMMKFTISMRVHDYNNIYRILKVPIQYNTIQ